jgi:hypothetical protein
MRTFYPALASLLLTPTVSPAAEPPARDMVLWYRQPGVPWLDALPIGNGIMGAMVFGGVPQERIALNPDFTL